jgi:beta-glucosidase
MIPSKIARVIYPEFRFGKTDINDALRLVDMGVGGFCLYGGTTEEVFNTIKILKSSSKTPLLFCADYENGVGQWIKGATELQSNMAVGASSSDYIARRKAEITAIESKALGVDWILAPVVDLASMPENPIVNVRAFGDSPGLVSFLADAYMSGINSQHAISCLKHFPGHGETSCDSHLELPVLNRTRDELEGYELKPYKSLLKNAPSVMIGHLKIDAIDKENASSLSNEVITGILRNELQYDGCVITDALSMKAIANEEESAIKALIAGADVLLVPENPSKLYEALIKANETKVVSNSMLENAIRRQDFLVKKTLVNTLNRPGLDVVGCKEHKKFVEETALECIAWAWRRQLHQFVLKEGDNVGYFEPMTEAPDWKGKSFVEQLTKSGVKVRPFDKSCEKLIVASFSKPRAFSGSINLNEEEKKAILQKIIQAKETLMIAFGSPFVFKDLEQEISAGLCAFCNLLEYQIACAQIISGIASAKGRIPVKIQNIEYRM